MKLNISLHNQITKQNKTKTNKRPFFNSILIMMLAILLKTTETYDLNLSRESLAQDASNDNINPAPYKQQSPDY